MREKTDSEEDSAPGVGDVPWHVVSARALPDYRLDVRFADGTEGIVDVSRMILGSNAGVFEALRDPTVFAQARIEYGAVTWPGDVDLAPDAMHAEILANGHWEMAE